MRDLLTSSCEICASVASEQSTSSHVSNLTRYFTRLSGKPTTSWKNLLQLRNQSDDQHLQVRCKEVRQRQYYPTITVLSTNNMHRYSTSTSTANMTYTGDTAEAYSFANQDAGAFTIMDSADASHDGSQPGSRPSNVVNMANFTATSLDPSAGFPGLGDLPSAGIDSPVDTHTLSSGTFTGDLNISSSAYASVADDHSQLLQEMLQQQSQSGQSSQTDPPQQQGGPSASAWEDSLHVLQEMLLMQQQQQAQQIYQSQADQVFSQAYNVSMSGSDHHHHQRSAGNMMESGAPRSYNSTCHSMKSLPTTSVFPGESELLSLLQLPRTSSLPSFAPTPSNRGKGPLFSTSSIAGPVNTGEFFESRLGLSHGSLHHNSAASLFHTLPSRAGADHLSLPNNNVASSATPSSLFNRQAPILLDLDPDRDHHDPDGIKLASTSSPFGTLKRGSVDHSLGSSALGKGAGSAEPRGVNHFATERQRREFLNEKYQTLRSLVPNPTKADRASIVADAIDYVKELKRTVQELQLLVQEKRRAAGGLSGRKRSYRSMDQAALAGGDGGLALPGAGDQSTTDSASNSQSYMVQKGTDAYLADHGAHLRSSWLQRTSQTGTQVDVRIVHDEVTIKLTQRRRKNCLLDVFGVLVELHLDLLQASGASIGEHDVFLFNTKILEGSSTFAGYIAAKMLDAVDHRPLM